MKNKLLMSIASVIGFCAVALAEGESAAMDTTAATTMIQSAKTGLENILTTVTPYISTLVLAGLAIWAGLVIIRLVKRAFSRAA